MKGHRVMGLQNIWFRKMTEFPIPGRKEAIGLWGSLDLTPIADAHA